jgi:hypothetical protein
MYLLYHKDRSIYNITIFMGQFGASLAYNTRKNFFKLRGEVLRLKVTFLLY